MTVEEGYVAVDPAQVSVDALDDALWKAAEGAWHQEAAVLLLTFHGHWTRRPAFRRYVTVEQAEGDPAGPMWATVDWAGLAGEFGRPYDPEREGDQLLVCSSRELRVLRLAASIAGGHPVDLSDVLDAGFDDTNARLVQAAVVHAMRGFGGASALWPERP